MNNNYKIKEILANKELFDWIELGIGLGAQKFLLKYNQILGSQAAFIAEQINLQKKIDSKLPTWHKAKCLFTTKSFEQCTAEKVAIYKSTLIFGKNLLSLASGIGVDDWAFAKNFEQVNSIDNDLELNEIATFNFIKLGINNTKRMTFTAENFLTQNIEKYSAIYIDPDRRIEDKRQILLSEHQPNIVSLLPQLLNFSNHIWIKCSPLYDIDMALKELNNVKSIYIISLYGEVKEMLLEIEKNFNYEPDLICVDIQKKEILEQKFSLDKITFPPITENISGYLHEVGASIVKVRKHHEYAFIKNLKLINVNVPFYIGDNPVSIIGKCFKVNDVLNYNFSEIKSYCKKQNITFINAKARGLKFYNTHDFYKKTGLKEGGELFAWICPFKGKNIVIVCSKIEF